MTEDGGDRQGEPVLRVPVGPVGLSTSSLYPDGPELTFQIARRLGYDGVEVMVWTDETTQDSAALRELSARYEMPIVSIHAPTLLMTQRVWGTNPWDKVDRSAELANAVGAPLVVLHPPFRWQQQYGAGFVAGVAARERVHGVTLAVENMFPWRAGRRSMMAYLPHWDPVPLGYDHVTLDLSHTATSHMDAVAMAGDLGGRLAHIHLADGLGSAKDEHLVPGRGNQPCGEVLGTLAQQGFPGAVVVEVATRKGLPERREIDLAESLAYARLHLASARG